MDTYIRKPTKIDAIKWTLPNTEYIVEWTAGAARYDPFGSQLKIEQKGGAIKNINVGDYVIRLADRTFTGMQAKDFDEEYIAYKVQPHGETELEGVSDVEREATSIVAYPESFLDSEEVIPEDDIPPENKGPYTTAMTGLW